MARQKFERQLERRAASAHRRRTRNRVTAIAVVAVLVLGSVGWVVVNRTNQTADETAAASDSSASSAPASPEASSLASSAPASPAASASAAPSTATSLSCAEPVAARADDQSWPTAPQPSALSQQPAAITLSTNCGKIVITTLPQAAPLTVASEVFLTEQGFYDKTSCHRLTTSGIFVLQCGDPKGDGTGGPGYSVPDENLPSETSPNYPAGTVAMANAGPGTAGSQFFIVYQDTTLPPGYTIWGKVTRGLDIVQALAGVGVSGGGSDGPPGQPLSIETATVAAL